MSRSFSLYALWTLAIVGAATVVIMYQHARHTGIVLDSLGAPVAGLPEAPQSGTIGGGADTATGTISANPINSGAASRATGQWTPLGPTNKQSIMAYNPGQAFQ